MKILLVEDDPDHLELAMHVLKKQGWDRDVEIARDGEEAVDVLLGKVRRKDRDAVARHPRLVLLDIKIPRIGGLEVLRMVRADERLDAVPIVMMTSSAEEQDIRTSYRDGANGFIVKPTSFDAFADCIEHVTTYWLRYNTLPTR